MRAYCSHFAVNTELNHVNTNLVSSVVSLQDL